MAVTIRYHDDGQGVELVCRGIVTSQELIEANNRICRPDTLRVLKYQIVDFTGVEGFYVGNEAVVSLAEQDRRASEINRNLCIAIIADQDLPYGLSRMWQAHISECPFCAAVFRRRADAMAWLRAQLEFDGAADEDAAEGPVGRPDQGQ